MKRPLCLLAILVTAAVFIYLELFLSDLTGKVPDDLDGSTITVVGKVQDKAFRKDFTGEILPVIYILPNDQDISEYNLIQCYLDSSDSLPAIGQYAKVSGRVKVFSSPTNPGEFDSRLYYSSLKISYRLNGCSVLGVGGNSDSYRECLFKIRMFFEAALDRALSAEDSAIMKAMLLGDKAYMDSEIKEMYKDSGIIHILAVSGLHISIIGMGVYEALRKLRANIYLSAIVSILFMYSYGIMCGMGTSSFRAICMFALRLLAPVLGRTYDVLSALALAAILLLIDQPLYLYNSGFLFSFGAVVGIVVVRPLLVPVRTLLVIDDEKMKFVDEENEKCLSLAEVIGGIRGTFDVNAVENISDVRLADGVRKWQKWLASSLTGVTTKVITGLIGGIAVAITTLPVYACFYYTYPIHSLVLNLAVIPAMGVLMLLGIVCMLLSAIGLMFAGMAATKTMGGLTGMAAVETICGLGGMAPTESASGFMGMALKVPGSAVHCILALYRWLCSSNSIRSRFTWYMGHADKWQVAVYIVFVLIFVALSMGIRPLMDKIGSKAESEEYGKSKDWRPDLDKIQDKLNVHEKSKFLWEIVDSDRYRTLFPVLRRSKAVRALVDTARFVLLLAAALLLTFHVEPQLEIDMIDVGQGDGIVISSAGHHILIDGGSSSKKNVGKYQIIPFLKYQGIGKLDAAVVTHEDQDHISGLLEIMDDMERGGIRICKLVLPEVSESSRGDNYHRLELRANDLGIPIAYINSGEAFSLGKVSFTCLNPELNMTTEGANAYSTVLFMEYASDEHRMMFFDKHKFNGSPRHFTALFTGDVEGSGQEFLKSVLKSDPDKYSNLSLLKVAHHGSQYTTDEEFLSMTNPRVALISCGKNNSYGHPHEALLERLDEAEVKVFRTDQGGYIRVVPDINTIVISQYTQ